MLCQRSSDDETIIVSEPIVIPPSSDGGTDDERADAGADAEPSSPAEQTTLNPDYPGIDPSQWETVEDTMPPPQEQKLSYDELAKALEEAALEYEKGLGDEGKQEPS